MVADDPVFGASHDTLIKDPALHNFVGELFWGAHDHVHFATDCQAGFDGPLRDCLFDPSQFRNVALFHQHEYINVTLWSRSPAGL